MWQYVLAVLVVRVTLNALWGYCSVYLHLIALGPTQHYTFLWVDRFSKVVHFTSLEKLTTPTETAKLLTHHVFRLHGISAKIVSDQGSQLISQVWKTFCSALSAKVCVCSGFHLQITGQLERLNKELETSLRCVTFQNPSSWSSQLALLGHITLLPPLLLFFRPSKHFQGTSLHSSPPQKPTSPCQQCSNNYRGGDRCGPGPGRTSSRRSRETSIMPIAVSLPLPPNDLGQKVWLSAKDIPLMSLTRKLAPRFIGPYEIDSVINQSCHISIVIVTV